MPTGQDQFCDPEFELCQASWNDPMFDGYMYAPWMGDLAVLIYGIIGVINVATPILLYVLYQEMGDRLAEKSAFSYAWRFGSMTHVFLFGLIALLWPFTYLNVDFINWTFLMWANIITFAAITVYWVIIGVLATSIWTYNALDAKTSLTEQWITLGVYALFAGITGAAQIIFMYPLNYWYYVNPYVDSRSDDTVGDEENEEELEIANLASSFAF